MAATGRRAEPGGLARGPGIASTVLSRRRSGPQRLRAGRVARGRWAHPAGNGRNTCSSLQHQHWRLVVESEEVMVR